MVTRSSRRSGITANPSMPKRITSVAELASELSDRVEELITVDGLLASGKSTLAAALADVLQCPVIGCDSYLEQDKNTFLEALRYDDLHRDLSFASNQSGRVILEGACIREVMRRLSGDFSEALTIYVRRMSTSGNWDQADELEPTTPSMRRAVSALTGEPYVTPRARCEVREYHQRYLPHENADILYEWIQD